MFDKIISFSIKRKAFIGALTIMFIAWGTWSVIRLPIDAVPDITNNQVQIITSAPSQAAQDIERLVTFPVEQVVSKIPGIVEIRSFSRFGLSVVTVVFKDNIDVYWARQQVGEKLAEAKTQIPAGIASPELAPVTTGLGEIYQYVLHPLPGFEKQYNAMELRSIQDWIVRRRLLGVEGVADVSSFGGLLKQYEVALDPDKLKAMNVTIAEVFTALEKNNQNTGGAYIDKGPNAYFIRSEGLIENTGDIENVVIRNTVNGTPVLIRNIGEVKLGHAIRYGAMTRNTDGEMVGGLVLMLKGENASRVIENVKRRVAEIEKTLPEGVAIEPFIDRTRLVNSAISTVTRNLAEGALIVVFILVLFLGNLRAGLLVASVIPLSMLFAIGLMNLFGVTGNLMSLGAIDFGLIVDGAVIIVESVVHRIASGKNYPAGTTLARSEMDEEVNGAASKIMSSAAFGEIIILIVYLPILALSGIEGKMFRPMAETVSFAILGAFILSLTYVPMMSSFALSRKTAHRRNISDRMLDLLQRFYQPLISRTLGWSKGVVVAAVVLFAGAVIVFRSLGAEFLPSLDEGDFAVEMRLLTGSGLSKTVDVAQKAAGILLRGFPDEVKEVVAKIGSAEIPTDPMPLESGDLMVILKDRSKWVKASDKDELAEKMAAALQDVPGVSFGFQQPIQMRFNELIAGARQDVVVKIFGEDLEKLSSLAGKISALLPTVTGVKDVYVEKVTGLPQIVIRYRRDQIARFGMNIRDINQTINAAFAGQSAGIVYEGERRYDLVVRLGSASRSDIEDVKALYVYTPAGGQVPLQQVADVDMVIGPNQIQRDDAKRRITVGFNVRGRDVESVVNELKQKVSRDVVFDPGYYATYGGSFKNLEEGRQRLAYAVPAALLLILALLYFTFRSLKQSLIIFTAIPLSAIGGIIALWMRDMPFSISAGVGFIALFGVAVLNGIVLISEFNSLKKNGVTDIRERIRRGTQVRLRPVLMTASVASLGFLPMALSNGSGAEVQKPLATVVIGGLVTATLLTLFVLPCIYLLVERSMNKKRKVNPAALMLLLIVGGFCASGQTATLSLDSALDLALRNNKGLQAIKMRGDFYRFEKSAASQLPKTDVSVMIGQYNGFYRKDNNISISQTIPFPSVFSARSALAASQAEGEELRAVVSRNELVYQLRSAYNALAYLGAELQLIDRLDSLYDRGSKAATLRYNTGETNLLEKTSADLRHKEILNRRRQIENDVAVYTAEIRAATGAEVLIAPRSIPLSELPLAITPDTGMQKSPVLAFARQQVEIANNERLVINRSALPEFRIGYFNQSLYGVPLNDASTAYATAQNRFQGFQVGILLPVWFVPEVKKASAYRTQVGISEALFRQQQVYQSANAQRAVAAYRNAKSMLAYYRNEALPAADLMLKQMETVFDKGDISVAEQILSLQQAVTIRENYLLALKNYNDAVIYLEFITAAK